MQEQNQRLESRIQSLARAVNTLHQQNSHLIQICSALANNSGIVLDNPDEDMMGRLEPRYQVTAIEFELFINYSGV